MTSRGKVRNGVVILDNPRAFAEGAEVRVAPIKEKGTARNKKPSRALLKLAGKAKGLPADAARNLDHYLYGHPKR
jgi:hypothetical protein